MIAALAVALPAPAAAGATNWYQVVLRTYSTTGTIPPCRFTSQELRSALGGVDAYGQQYFGDFTNAVQAALSERASGSCARRSATPVGHSGTSRAPIRLGPLTAASSAGAPAPLVLMGVLAGLFLLGAALVLVARATGSDPAWAAAWRHGLREGSYRLSAAWADFRDRRSRPRPRG